MSTIERGKPRPVGDRYRLLVLIEDATQMEKIRVACRLLDQEIVPVSSIQEGMDFLETKDHVDVVIAEAFLQNESVFDFLTRVRKMPDHERVPVMIVAVDPGEIGRFCAASLEGTAKILGAYKFLLMPEFDLDLLMKEVSIIIPAETTPRKEKL